MSEAVMASHHAANLDGSKQANVRLRERWRRSASRDRLGAGVLVTALSFTAPLFVNAPSNRALLVVVAVYALLGTAMNWGVGFCGDFNFSIAAACAVGMYGAPIMTKNHELPYWIGLLVLLVIAVPVAWLVGLILARSHGIYFALASFGVAQLVMAYISTSKLTGAAFGLPVGLSTYQLIPGLDSDVGTFVALLGLGAILMVLLDLLLRRRAGWTVVSIRENLELARSVGVPTAAVRALVFAAGTGLAVTTGYLWAPYARIAQPGQFGLSLTINVLVVVVLGGVGSTYGVILGAWLVTFLPDFTAAANEWAMILFGAFLTVAALFFPKGLAGAVRTPVDFVANRPRRREERLS